MIKRYPRSKTKIDPSQNQETREHVLSQMKNLSVIIVARLGRMQEDETAQLVVKYARDASNTIISVWCVRIDRIQFPEEHKIIIKDLVLNLEDNETRSERHKNTMIKMIQILPVLMENTVRLSNIYRSNI